MILSITFIFISGKFSFASLGNESICVDDYPSVYKEAEQFVMACYGMSHCKNITIARQEVWQKKMAKCLVDHPQLATLPPTVESFTQNALRGHLQLAIWYSCVVPDPPLMDVLLHGYKRIEGSSNLNPVMLPPGTASAPLELIKLIKCACKSTTRACLSDRCACRSNGRMACTVFCECKGGDPAITND